VKIKVSLQYDKNQRVCYMKTNIHLWSYLAHFFLEREMFQKSLAEKIKTHIAYSTTFFTKMVLFLR